MHGTSYQDAVKREERCPAWCIADHEQQGAADQRWHYSACTELPLVEMGRSESEEGRLVDVALPFDVALEQPWGSSAVYVLLGVGAQRERTFCLTLESAERLVAAVRDAVHVGRTQP